MEHGKALTVAVAFLLVSVAALLYLEWWRADELGSLNERVVDLELARRRRERKTTAAPAAPEGAAS